MKIQFCLFYLIAIFIDISSTCEWVLWGNLSQTVTRNVRRRNARAHRRTTSGSTTLATTPLVSLIMSITQAPACQLRRTPHTPTARRTAGCSNKSRTEPVLPKNTSSECSKQWRFWSFHLGGTGAATLSSGGTQLILSRWTTGYVIAYIKL